MSKERELAVLGAGIAGVTAALKLAKNPNIKKIYLIDKLPQPLDGSSNRNPARASIHHYIDEETAKKNFKITLELIREYPEFVLGVNDLNYKRGNYYVVMKDSKYSLEEIEKTFLMLKNEYEKAIDSDPKNKVFGDPEDFYKEIYKSDELYPESLNEEKVMKVYKTAEQLLDWPKLKAHLIDKIEKNEKIKFLNNTKVTQVNKIDGLGWQVDLLENNNAEKKLKVDMIVNSLWEGIDKINEGIGFKPKGKTLNRIKAMVIADIPKDYSNGNILCCFGSHCGVSVAGRLYITSEKESNIEANWDGLSEKSQRLLDGNATKEEKKEIIQAIIDGAAEYIHILKGIDTENCKVVFGNVQQRGLEEEASEYKGKSLLDDPNSPIHLRRDIGVNQESLTYFTNAALKLAHFLENAKLILSLFDESHLALTLLEEINNRLTELSNELNLAKAQRLNIIKELELVKDPKSLTCHLNPQSRRSLKSGKNLDNNTIDKVLNMNFPEKFKNDNSFCKLKLFLKRSEEPCDNTRKDEEPPLKVRRLE